jgi:hypothetical protein
MARLKFPIVSRPVHSAPARFPWMGIAAALIILSGAYALSVASTAPATAPEETATLQTVTN